MEILGNAWQYIGKKMPTKVQTMFSIRLDSKFTYCLMGKGCICPGLRPSHLSAAHWGLAYNIPPTMGTSRVLWELQVRRQQGSCWGARKGRCRHRSTAQQEEIAEESVTVLNISQRERHIWSKLWRSGLMQLVIKQLTESEQLHHGQLRIMTKRNTEELIANNNKKLHVFKSKHKHNLN